MTEKPTLAKSPEKTVDPHPGMMGDGTEEQSLGQTGDPAARIKKEDVEEAFRVAPAKKS